MYTVATAIDVKVGLPLLLLSRLSLALFYIMKSNIRSAAYGICDATAHKTGF